MAEKVGSVNGFDIKKGSDGLYYVCEGGVKVSGPHRTKTTAEHEAEKEHKRRHPTPTFDPF